MSWKKNKSKGKINVLLAGVCIVLAILMGMILIHDHRIQARETARLMELAEDQKKGIEDYERVKKRADALEKQSAEALELEEESQEETASEEEHSEEEDSGQDQDSDQVKESK